MNPNCMTKIEIIEQFAKERKIEKYTLYLQHTRDTKDDLSQLIYLYLLDMDEVLFFDLLYREKLDPYIKRMISIQNSSKNSKHYRSILMFNELSDEIKNDNYPYE